MTDASKFRRDMVEQYIAARGVRSVAVLEAMRNVPREEFLPGNLREFAYEDRPLPIAEGQTISQPYIVAFMVEALALEGGEKVLEIGAGSGYAAAVLSEIAGEVYTVERIGQLAEKAASVLADLGYSNVHVLHGDGTLGWKEHAPYDAIIVAAGGPDVPDSLKEQLKIGGRLVIPVGTDPRIQELVRVTRLAHEKFKTEDIADVRFVPLVGEEGWAPTPTEAVPPQRVIEPPRSGDRALAKALAASCEPFDDIDPADLAPLLERIGDARVVLLGEATYGQAALSGTYHTCEDAVADMLVELLKKRTDYTPRDGERFMDAVQNARLVTNAERYYRIMYYGSRASWNLRDSHMFETLLNLLEHHGRDSKAIIWAHNSHIGDAAATEMSLRGEFNIGQLCRKDFGDQTYSIGFGTNTGTVAAASNWDEAMEIKTVRPAVEKSYERLCHETGWASFMLGLRESLPAELERALSVPRLERAIGVIYRPETELASHYFHAVLPEQFDEYIWFDETSAVAPLETLELEGLPDTYPFGV